jgi:hypothetical protein
VGGWGVGAEVAFALAPGCVVASWPAGTEVGMLLGAGAAGALQPTSASRHASRVAAHSSSRFDKLGFRG